MEVVSGLCLLSDPGGEEDLNRSLRESKALCGFMGAQADASVGVRFYTKEQ